MTTADRRLFDQVWLNGQIQPHAEAIYPGGRADIAPPSLHNGTREQPLPHTKRALAAAAVRVCRATGSGGSSYPGSLLLRLAPDAIGRLGARLEGGTTLVSGTNGKTTTAAMIASMLRAAGRRPVHNRSGANMHFGVAAALAEQHGTDGVFEVDELWMPLLAAEMEPRLLVLSNLFRDRLDFYGEVDRLAELWQSMAARCERTALVLNADDPRVAWLAEAGPPTSGPGAMTFGIDDQAVAREAVLADSDGRGCRRCGAALEVERSFIAHLSHYSCPSCGLARPLPDVAATRVRLEGVSAVRLEVRTPAGPIDLRVPMPGLYNAYNALAAIAAGLRLGLGVEAIRAGIEGMEVPFGRAEAVRLPGGEALVLLMKNPAGANELLRTIAHEADGAGLDLWIALNDNVPDGRDVSWIWDVDFEPMAGLVASVACTGTRAADLALRLKYAGWPVGESDMDPSISRSFESATARAPGRLFALPTYSAMLELRVALGHRGIAPHFWE